MNRPLIVADENIPALDELFGRDAEIRRLPGRSIDAAALADAEVLLVRSVTTVNPALLEHSPVRFVGSATAGTDHVDHAWLAQRGIQFAYAPGSNADAVVDWVCSALSRVEGIWEQLLGGEARVGIIGCGQVGGRLLARLQGLGIDCRVHDPFLSDSGRLPLVSLEQALGCDVVSLHTPLTRSGPHPTHHLLNERRLALLRAGALLLNAARGAVVDNAALGGRLKAGDGLRAALDVWEGEPVIDTGLLQRAALGTPHIAGYSLDGKRRGTQMLYRAWCEWRGGPSPSAGSANEPVPELAISAGSRAAVIRQAVLGCYDIARDDADLRRVSNGPASERGAAFDRLRRDYGLGYGQDWGPRREFSACEASLEGAGAQSLSDLRALGFRC